MNLAAAAVAGHDWLLTSASVDDLRRAAHRVHILAQSEPATYQPALDRLQAVLAQHESGFVARTEEV